MHLTHGLTAFRSAGGRSARLLLALALLAGAFTMTVVRAEPASAWTIQRSPTQIVLTSERLHDVTVRTTQIITLNHNGDVTYRVEAHNSGRTRKYFSTADWVSSPAGTLRLDFGLRCQKIGGETYASYGGNPVYNAQVQLRWDDIVNDPHVDAYFNLDAMRVNGCNIIPVPPDA